MVQESVLFFCMAGLFFSLLCDRFRFAVTLGGTAAAYLCGLVAAWGLGRLSVPQDIISAAGAGIFLLSALALYRNNLLQKLFVSLVCVSGAVFLNSFTQVMQKVLPSLFSGTLGAVCAALLCVLFFLVMGLCLYHPLHHFIDRTASGFLWGMCLLLLVICVVAKGGLDVLFKAHLAAMRVALSLLGFGVMMFSVRSVYHAAKFREQTVNETMRKRLTDLRIGDYGDLVTARREVQAAQRMGVYALDTVAVLLADGLADRIPEYLEAAKENALHNPMLRELHHNPQLNALLTVKSAYAARQGLRFDCNAAAEALPLPVPEVCLMADELLSRACRDCEPNGRVSFTLAPTEDSLRMEVLYTAKPQEPERFTVKGKRAEEVLHSLLENDFAEEQELAGLDTVRDLCARYNGTLTVTAVGEEMNISLTLKR